MWFEIRQFRVVQELKTRKITWFSAECILRSNFQRANIYWKYSSLFWFWMTTSQGIFGGGFFRLIFTKGKLCVLTLRYLLPDGVILFTLLTEVECSNFSWNAILCVVWILPFKFSFLQSKLSHQNKLEHVFLVDLALKEGDSFAG